MEKYFQSYERSLKVIYYFCVSPVILNVKTSFFLISISFAAAMLEFTYRGVNLSVPSTGGPECANYLPVQRRIWETVFGVAFAGLLIWIGWKNLYPVVKPSPIQWRDRWGRNILLMSMCLVIGCEVGFKLQAQSTIFLLNPCHVTTAIQVYYLLKNNIYFDNEGQQKQKYLRECFNLDIPLGRPTK